MIWLPGKPTPLPRPRAAVRAGHAVVYTDPKARAALTSASTEINRQWEYLPPLDGPVLVVLEFVYTSPTRKQVGTPKLTRPDIDNLVKFTLDAANGILFHDDRQVVQIEARKLYGDEPGTRIHIAQTQTEAAAT